jgi:hypothetical protein
VGGENDGAFGGLQLFDQAVNFETNLGIEAGGGLIQKEKAGIVDQRQRERDALFLAAGELRIKRIPFVGELQTLQNLFAIRVARIEGREQVQRFPNLDLFGQVGGLKADADAILDGPDLDSGIEAEDANLAGGARTQAFQNLYSSGLAGAVGTQQAEHLALLHFKVDTAHGFEIAITFLQAANADCGVRHFLLRPSTAAYSLTPAGSIADRRMACSSR